MNEAIVASNLRVSLSGRNILGEINFSLPQGAYLAVVGPNGSGKSTLIRCILGLVKPTSGSISIASGQRIGYVPQIKTLDRSFPARSCDLVATGVLRKWPFRLGDELHQRVHEALDAVGVGNLADAPLSKLSGGELQRVYLARAIIQEPDLLLLDEPATGIDFKGEEAIHDTVESLRKRRNSTVVIVTHDLITAKYHASHVVVLRGVQLAFGPQDEALNDENMRLAFGHSGHSHSMPGGSD